MDCRRELGWERTRIRNMTDMKKKTLDTIMAVRRDDVAFLISTSAASTVGEAAPVSVRSEV